MAAAGRAPSKLADFKFHERLGSGSFGDVYKVRRKIDNNLYVMKQINIRDLTPKEQLEAINEVKIMAELESPYCVRYYDSFIDDGRLNIVMEFCDGGDLQQFLKAQGSTLLPEDRIWSLFIQVALGLHYLHTKRILHRDIKTANVFVYGDLSVRIGDLGVARVLGTNTHFARTCVGTPYYLSPELCEDKPYDQKSDVWALGCVLYECCTLKHPFDAKNQGALIWKILQGKYPKISSMYSSHMHKILAKLLSRDASVRPIVSQILCSQVVQAKAKAAGIEMPPDIKERVAKRQAVREKQAARERARREGTGSEGKSATGGSSRDASGLSVGGAPPRGPRSGARAATGSTTKTGRPTSGSGSLRDSESGSMSAGTGTVTNASSVTLSISGSGTGVGAGSAARNGKAMATAGNVRGGRVRKGAPARKPRTKQLPPDVAAATGVNEIGVVGRRPGSQTGRRTPVGTGDAPSAAATADAGAGSGAPRRTRVDDAGTTVSFVSGRAHADEVADLPDIPDGLGEEGPEDDNYSDDFEPESGGGGGGGGGGGVGGGVGAGEDRGSRSGVSSAVGGATPVKRGLKAGSGTRSRPTLSDLHAATSSALPPGSRIASPPREQPASESARVADAAGDDIDDIMSRQFEEDMAGAAQAKKSPEKPVGELSATDAAARFEEFAFGGTFGSDSNSKDSADDFYGDGGTGPAEDATLEGTSGGRGKRTVLVQRTGDGVPEGFWDPVVPPSADKAGGGSRGGIAMGTGRRGDVSISDLEVTSGHAGGDDERGAAPHAEWMTGAGDWEVDEGTAADGVLWAVREDDEEGPATARPGDDDGDGDGDGDGEGAGEGGGLDGHSALLYDAPAQLARLMDEAQQIESQIKNQRAVCEKSGIGADFLDQWSARAADDSKADEFVDSVDVDVDPSDPVILELLKLNGIERYHALRLWELYGILRRVERNIEAAMGAT